MKTISGIVSILLFPYQVKGNEGYPKLRFNEFKNRWIINKITDFADVIGGGTLDTLNRQFLSGNIHWFTLTEVGHTKYVDKSIRNITEQGLKKSSAKIYP